MDWPIFTLVNVSAVTTLIGSSPPRFWRDAVPETASPVTLPYAVWQIVGGAPENYLDGVPGIDAGRVQVSVWAASADSAHAVAKAIRNAIEPSAHMVSVPISTYEPDTKRYGYLLQFQFWTAR